MGFGPVEIMIDGVLSDAEMVLMSWNDKYVDCGCCSQHLDKAVGPILMLLLFQ